MLYAACTTENAIVAVTTSLDGVGMRGSIQQLFSYGVNWKAVSSLCIILGKMFTVSTLGIEMVNLENAVQSIRVVDNARDGCHPFQVRKEALTSSSVIHRTARYTSTPLSHLLWKILLVVVTKTILLNAALDSHVELTSNLTMLSTQRTQCQKLLALHLPLLTLSNS